MYWSPRFIKLSSTGVKLMLVRLIVLGYAVCVCLPDFPFGCILFSLDFVRILAEFLVVGDHFFMETVVNIVEHALPEIGP
jgi:hypothetical protein